MTTTPATLAAQLRQIRADLIETRRYLDDHQGTERRITKANDDLFVAAIQFNGIGQEKAARRLNQLGENLAVAALKRLALPTILPNYIDAAVGELGWLASSLERVAESNEPETD